MKNLTIGKNLTIIPGTLVSYQKNFSNQTSVFNRAYVIHEGEVLGFQGKQNFHATDLEGVNAVKSADDSLNSTLLSEDLQGNKATSASPEFFKLPAAVSLLTTPQIEPSANSARLNSGTR
ncbi:hypothetical protein RVIR1_13870 [Candidatus Rickettsiella viridis]|uniref:Uncharacterized protein n=2 Tax=Candidatus Rickettsiella viridis TaxID=676208 RepID=A0A2Z5V608_9COXI|nr:hypothetical protein RVIR1_13870 [Candidatus Rickettsiella viridis]